MLAVQATNIGATPIRGYVFTASFFDPTTGNRLRRLTTKELETHGNPNGYLLPGATWVAGARKFSYLPDGTLASHTIILDLVVFADGSLFGPKQSSESDEVLGMFQGIDGANPSSKGTLERRNRNKRQRGPAQLHHERAENQSFAMPCSSPITASARQLTPEVG